MRAEMQNQVTGRYAQLRKSVLATILVSYGGKYYPPTASIVSHSTLRFPPYTPYLRRPNKPKRKICAAYMTLVAVKEFQRLTEVTGCFFRVF